MLESSPADHVAARREERLVRVGAAFETDPQSAELMQPAQRPFDDPAVLAQSAAVFGVAMGNHRGNPTRPQGHPMIVRVVCPIGVEQFRVASGTPRLTADRRNRIDEGNQLCDVMTVGRPRNRVPTAAESARPAPRARPTQAPSRWSPPGCNLSHPATRRSLATRS